MMKTIRTLAALALVGASFASNYSSALATTLKRMSVADLSRDSSHSRPRAMHHKLRALGCRRDLDLHHFRRRGNLERIGHLRKSQYVCSAAAPEISRQHVSGVPRFSPGEELILFLERTPAQDFSIVSWMQGTFRIGLNGTTGEETITQDTAAFPVFDPASQRFEATGIRKMPISAFHSLVIASTQTHAAQGSRQ